MSLRLPNDISDDERHAAWIRVIQRIYREQANQAWSHYMFRLLRTVFDKNERLSEEGGFIFNWLAENYVDGALMLLRRELDQQAGTENLRNLLEDIIGHPGVLTRARYCAAWGRSGPFDADLYRGTLLPSLTFALALVRHGHGESPSGLTLLFTT
jgi:hypothetical protein